MRTRNLLVMIGGVLLGAAAGTVVLAEQIASDSVSRSVEFAVSPRRGSSVVNVPIEFLGAMELAARIRDAPSSKQRMALLDMNPAEAFATAHIPGSVHLPDGELQPRHFPQQRDTLLVFICDRPRLRVCQQAAHRAAELGYRELAVVVDGVQGWADLGLPLETQGSETPSEN